MTIETTATYSRASGNGVTTVFAFTFEVFASTDLVVRDIVDATGVPTTKALTTDYTVTLSATGEGGTVTFLVAPASGHTIDIRSVIPLQQPTSIRNQGPFHPELHEGVFDRLERQIQDTRRIAESAIHFPDYEVARDMSLPKLADVAGKYIALDALGLPIGSAGTGNDSALRTDLAVTTSGSDGARLAGYRRTETGSVGTTVANVLRREVWIEDFGGAPGAGDNSAAFNAALTALIALGGGKLRFGTVGEWRMNVTVAADNIVIVMPKGRPEFDVNCIRPFNIATGPAITFGNGTTNYRYCGLENVSISGSNGTAGADRQVAKNASHCIRLLGGMVSFLALNSYFYNGVKTVSLEASATSPVTGTRFIGGGARNDLWDSASARTLYGVSINASGFYTDNVFAHFKLNGPGNPAAATNGYLAEFDGTLRGIFGEFEYCYADFRADFASAATVCHGVLLKGSAQIRCNALTLDPGANGVPIIESDQVPQDLGRYIVGELRQGAQRFKFSGGGGLIVSLPAEAETFNYKARIHTPTMVGPRALAIAADATAYPTTIQWELQGTTGPDRLTGSDLEILKDIRVWGGNAAQSGQITSVGVNGGLFLAAVGTNQNVRLVPSGTGSTLASGTALAPNADNATTCGSASNRWSTVYAAAGAINTSDERVKAEIEDIPASWLEAWGDVQWQRFKFKDALAEKGGGARWHVGLIAQRVVQAFAARGLDATEIGLVCYEEWGEEFEDVREKYVVDGKDGPITMSRFTGEKRLVRAAGNLWSMRYEEALAMECAYLRHRLDK